MAAPGGPIRVLHVDDEPDLAELAATYLEREDDRLDVATAMSATEGLDQLAEGGFDCVVSDYDMPGLDGIEFLERVREEHPGLPFILYTGKGGEEVASDAISAGVTDYLQKERGTSQYAVLANRITNSVAKYRAETELANRERRLNLFFEQSPFGVIRWDENFEFARVNRRAEQILGYEESELVGRSWEVIVPETDRGPVDDVVSALLEAEGGDHSVNENLRKDGEVIVCEWHNRVVTDDAGDVVAIYSQFRDITERRERRRELQRQRDRLDTVVSNVPLILFALDPDGTFTLSEGRGLSKLGLEPGEVVGESVFDVYADNETIISDVERALDGERITVTREVGDVVFDTTYQPIFDDDGTLTSVIGVSVDITERREREETIESLYGTTRSFMRADTPEDIAGIAVEAVRDILGLPANSVHLYDADANRLTPVAWTDRVEALVGEPPEFLPGEALAWEVFEAGEARRYDDVSTASGRLNPDTPVGSELIVPLEDHGVLSVASEAPGAFDETDVSLVQTLAAQMTTALTGVERERALERQNERLSEFASVVSHDLRSPLTVARGQVELAREDCQHDSLDDAVAAIDRGLALIDDLLALARQGEGIDDPEPVDLADAVERRWRAVETADATLDVAVGRTIRADPTRLDQLLDNLLRNAVEHGGDDVAITVGDTEAGFYVADDGPGVPAEEREEVFEAGYSTAADGTGFGLNIVREIAAAHGWTVTVTESADGGARFEIAGVESA